MPLMIFTSESREKIALNTDHMVSVRKSPRGYYEAIMTDGKSFLIAEDPESVVRRTVQLSATAAGHEQTAANAPLRDGGESRSSRSDR